MSEWSPSPVKTILAMFVACGLLCCGPAQADFVVGEPNKVPGVNSNASDSGPRLSRDGLELYFVSTRDSGDGDTSDNIWVARRATLNDLWSEPVKLDATVNTSEREISPSLSPDGLELYFGRWYTDVWVTRRTSKDAPWGEAEKVGPPISTGYAEGHPCISADGLSLYFISNRPGGGSNPTNSDIFVATRPTLNDPWEEPVKLGSNVNGSDFEYEPFISPDGLTLFFSRGYSKAQVYVSQRPTTSDTWGPARFVDWINSAANPWDTTGGSEFNVTYVDGSPMLYFSHGTSIWTTDWDVWQAEVTPIVDLNGDTVVDGADIAILLDHWGWSEPSCDICPIPLGDSVADDKDLEVLYDHVDASVTVVPTPALNEIDVTPFVSLTWTRGTYAQTYDVYLGTSFDDVLDASRTDPRGVLVSQDQDANTYAPESTLEFLQTYHWRVDEVNMQSDPAIVKGVVWSFTTETRGGAIRQIIATASSADPGAGPEHTVDGSGLNADDLHSADAGTMWLSAVDGPQPAWIQYEFDAVYPLDEIWVWNYNGVFDKVLGFGLKDVSIEYSKDGVSWTALGDFEFARATSQNGYHYNTVVDFGGAMARYVRLTALTNWGGMSPQFGLSEVRFFYVSPEADETEISEE